MAPPSNLILLSTFAIIVSHGEALINPSDPSSNSNSTDFYQSSVQPINPSDTAGVHTYNTLGISTTDEIETGTQDPTPSPIPPCAGSSQTPSRFTGDTPPLQTNIFTDLTRFTFIGSYQHYTVNPTPTEVTTPFTTSYSLSTPPPVEDTFSVRPNAATVTRGNVIQRPVSTESYRHYTPKPKPITSVIPSAIADSPGADLANETAQSEGANPGTTADNNTSTTSPAITGHPRARPASGNMLYPSDTPSIMVHSVVFNGKGFAGSPPRASENSGTGHNQSRDIMGVRGWLGVVMLSLIIQLVGLRPD